MTIATRKPNWRFVCTLAAQALLMLGGCATSAPPPTFPSGFDFSSDTFSYTNENYWIYNLGARSGAPIVKRRLEEIDHGQRCTIMARTARQFLYSARFDPEASELSDAEYRSLIQTVLDSNPRRERPTEPVVTIPGYANLRDLSAAHEQLLKDELGGRWAGYQQRGNWRMIFAFSPGQQRSTARDLVEDIRRGHLPLVHILNFPRIDINHTALVFEFNETPLAIHFNVYDPNSADGPVPLIFDRSTATFHYARTDYFPGGPAKVYEVYSGFLF